MEIGSTQLNYADAQLRLPPLEDIFEPAFYIPFLTFFFLFYSIGYAVRTLAWRDYSGFRQYRLRNLTVCLIHSFITGLYTLSFMLLQPKVMFHETMHWYQPWSTLILFLSMETFTENKQIVLTAYFVCDAVDMLQHEISRWTVELLLHHMASICVFACAVLPRKFIPYAYWALLMEVNR
ncbi:unnamed protein product [Anisakis simplex]|uniref:TLC domain-containing protein n=1 Tax=Anisakis simplex TaxID=6269 RepID=A0A0M3KK86_ANISI|nr:unnamed protein product [Anisakis simplex]